MVEQTWSLETFNALRADRKARINERGVLLGETTLTVGVVLFSAIYSVERKFVETYTEFLNKNFY